MRAEPSGPDRRFAGIDAALLFIVLAVALATFSGVLRAGFVWDDLLFIRDNPALRDLGRIPGFFVSGDAVGTYVTNPYYRPLVTTSFALDVALWGSAPAGFHATNLLLHLGVCATLFLVARRLIGESLPAFAAALLFAVHPAHAEPVAYVSARADLLCALLMLASCLGYLSDLARESRARRILSYAAFLLALLSKITAGVLPVLLALHLFAIARRGDRWMKLAPYAAIAAAFLAARSLFVGIGSWEGLPLADRVAAAGPFLMTYLRNAVLPFGLKVFYDLPARTSPADLSVIASWSVLAGCFGGFVLLLRRGLFPVAFGAAWFFAALLPVSGIAMTLFPAHVADRYLYIPLIGWALALGAVADRLAGMSAGRWRNLAFAAAAACAVLLAPTTSARLGDWRDSLGFWRSAWQGAPQNAYVLNNLGTSLRNAGALDEAEQALNAAILIEDRTAGPHINLAAVALARKDIGTAERQVRLALDLEPGNPIALNLLGVVNANRGRFEEAQRCFSDAARIWPGYPGALANIRQLARNMSARDARPVLMD